jgi:hypothetical protein
VSLGSRNPLLQTKHLMADMLVPSSVTSRQRRQRQSKYQYRRMSSRRRRFPAEVFFECYDSMPDSNLPEIRIVERFVVEPKYCRTYKLPKQQFSDVIGKMSTG